MFNRINFRSAIVMGLFVLVASFGLADVSMATDPAPSYTVDLTQVTLDITTVITALITLALVVFGGRKVLSLVKRG